MNSTACPRGLPGNLIALVLEVGLLTGSALGAGNVTKPSVILISVDTLRADHLSCYGYRAVRTPHIDALTKGGTLFSQVSAQVPLTLPSHVSLLTSTYPFASGIEDNGEQLNPDAVTLATVLKSRGYRTAAFVGSFVLDRRFGLSQGFDVYDSPFDIGRERIADPGDIKRSADKVVQAASQWIESNSSAPFFVFLHLYDLHTPYNLPPRLRARFRGSDYDAELVYVDEMLGVLLNRLEQNGLAEKALLIFTSDHGEGLGEHGEAAHGYFIYQSTVRVPLIIHWPSGAEAFRAQFTEPVGLLDVAPTILQYLVAPRPAQFQGRSLLDLLRGKLPQGPSEVCAESLYGRIHFGVTSLHSLRVGRYKYIEAPKPELYDLVRDPSEKHNLYVSQSALASSFRTRLHSIRSRYTVRRSSPQPLNPGAMARLRSLGYVASSGTQSDTTESGPDPKDRIGAFGRYGYALSLETKGRLQESRAVLEQLLGEDPGLIDVRLSLGLTLQELNQHQDAAEEFRRVLSQDPMNVVAHFNLGVSYVVLHRLEHAIKELEVALAIAPYYTRAEEELGSAFLEKGDFKQARAHLEHVLTIAPDDFTAHYTLGTMAMKEGSTDALLHLTAASKANPQSPDVHNALGSFYFLRGDLDGAQREFELAIRQAPDFGQAHYNLGLVFQKRMETDKAAQEFRLAHQAERQNQVHGRH